LLVSGQSVRYAAGVLLVAAGYYAAAQGGQALLLTGPAGAFWPATGVGIAVLYLGGWRWWPGVLLGDLLAREFTLPLWAVLTETAGNMARALLAVVILRRLVGRRAAMDQLPQVGAVFVAVAVGEAVSATVAMLVRQAGGLIDVSEMGLFWRSWWLGGLSGGLVVVPLALAWAHARTSDWRGRRAVEGALVLAAVAGLSIIAMSAAQPLTYMVFPAFIWAALRLGPQGATLAVAVGAVIAVLSTSYEVGPFVELSPTDSALNLQLYIVFAALTTCCLAAIVSERRRAALELAESQRREGERAALERQRIARDLHDSVSQSLFSTTLHVRTAQRALEVEQHDASGPVGDELHEIGQLTRGAPGDVAAPAPPVGGPQVDLPAQPAGPSVHGGTGRDLVLRLAAENPTWATGGFTESSSGSARVCRQVPCGRIHCPVVHRQSEPELRRAAITMARSSGRAFFTNFSTYDASFATRTRLALANSWKKVRTRSDCCGNYGQPGC
jgi:integral membrane sensor domain MASE1